MKLYIRPVPRTSPVGVTTKHNDIVSFDDGSEFSAQKSKLKRNGAEDKLTVPHNGRKFIVWDDEPQANPYYGDKTMNIPSNWIDHKDLILKSENLPDQMLAEIKYNVPKGFLTDKLFLYSPGTRRNYEKEPLTFIEDIRTTFSENTNVFDTENERTGLRDYIWIKAIQKTSREKKSSIFANSLEQLPERPKAMYYIYEEEKEVTAKLNESVQETKARYYLYPVLEEWNDLQRYKLAVMLDLNVDQSMSPKKVKELLNDYIVKPNKNVKVNYSLFIKSIDMYNDKTKNEIFEHEFLIKELVKNRILNKSKSTPDYTYFKDGNYYPIGDISVLKSLNKKENKDLLDELKQQLKDKGYKL